MAGSNISTTSIRLWRYFAPRVLPIGDFAGGLNLRDAQSELAASESPNGWNITLDERGGVAKRLGYVKYNPAVYDAGNLVKNAFYWQTGQNLVVQCGTKLYLDTSTVSFKTFTTSERVGFADFNGKLWIIHPTDGLFQSDGTGGGTSSVASGPKGSTIIPWQNRLVAYDVPNKQVAASALADGTDWAIGVGHGWTNKLWEKDREDIVCLASASGVDISGRPGLLAFKKNSTYRIYDSSTGAYQTIDPQVGAASALSVTNYGARTIVLSPLGIYWTDGVSQLQSAGDREQPLWDPTQIAFDQTDLFCAGFRGDRVYFSLPRAGQTANTLALEYHPIQGWIVAGSNAASCYATFRKNTQLLYSGSPSVNGQVYQQLSGGADDGAAIASWFQTRWYEPAGGVKTRLRRLRVKGRGNFTLSVKTDYSTGMGTAYPISISRGGFVWNDPTSIWNNGTALWGPATYESFSPDVVSMGTARAVSFRIDETSTTVASAPTLLDTGTAPQVGGWGLYGLDLLWVPLGLS